MDTSKTKNAFNNTALSQEEALTDVVQALNTVLEDMFVLNYGPDNFYQGLAFKTASYTGSVLCLSTNKAILVFLDIANETFTLQPYGENNQFKRAVNIMPLKLLWIAFYVYLSVKGKTNHYKDCYSRSCIRHLYDEDMINYSQKDQLTPAQLN